MTNKYNKWTREEMELINNMDLSLEDLSKLLPNRTYHNIASKRSRLGLSRQNKAWTQEEIDLLINHYQAIISLIHNHSHSTILDKGSKLGLAKKRP